MHDTSRELALCSTSPSIGRCSSVHFEIAARVVDEFRVEEPQSDDHWRYPPPQNFEHDGNDDVSVGYKAADDDDRGFEFEFVCREPAITADEIFFNGQIRPLYPYAFDLAAEEKAESEMNLPARHRRPALRKLMSQERDSASCMSSEGDDELSGVSPDAYCVWNPKRRENLLGVGDQSCAMRSRIRIKSLGSSLRWNLRNLWYIGSSREGKETFKSLQRLPKRS